MSKLSPCACGSTNIKEYNPYGVESVHCKDCFVSLRLVDWNRIMNPLQKSLDEDLSNEDLFDLIVTIAESR